MSAYCTSCGSPIPDGQGSSRSMCYGDVAYGSDGYYAEYMQACQVAQEQEREQARHYESEEQ